MIRFIISTVIFILLLACGEEHVVDRYKDTPVQPLPTPTPTPTGTSSPITYPQMQGLLVTYCQPCHASAQFMSSEAALRASVAKDYLWSRRMPLASSPKPLPDNLRTQMLSFFQ